MNPSSIGLTHQTIRRRRQDLSAFFPVVLDGIDQGLRVFNAHTHRKGFGFQCPSFGIKQFKNIPCAVPRGEDQPMRSASVAFARCDVLPLHSVQRPAHSLNVDQPRTEMHLPSCLANGLAHALDDLGQLVRPNVRMRLHQNRGVCTEVHQPFQGTADVTALVASCVQLSIAVSAGSAFSKAIIRIGIHQVIPGDFHQIPPALTHRLTALKNHGPAALSNECESSKQPSRTRTDDVYRFRIVG